MTATIITGILQIKTLNCKPVQGETISQIRSTPPSAQGRFSNRSVIVTGASSGLGAAIARGFAAEGASVVLAGRNTEQLEQTAASINSSGHARALAVPCDITQRDQVERVVTTAVSEFGRIDVLVNNAGIGMIAPVEFVELRDAIALFETNFFGALSCAQAVLPHMQRQRSGQIVNISSVGGLRGIPNIGIYSASKAGLMALSDALRLEVRPFGISVTVVCTGRITDTQFFDRATRYGPLKLYEVLESLTPEQAAAVVVNATAKRKRLVVVPFRARLWYAADKLFPRVVDRFLQARMPQLERSNPNCK